MVSLYSNKTTKMCGDGKELIKVKTEKNDKPTFQTTQTMLIQLHLFSWLCLDYGLGASPVLFMEASPLCAQ